jgi:hypothetical protein
MARKIKFNKQSVMSRIVPSLVGAGIGAVTQVLEGVIGDTAVEHPEYVALGELAIGIVLPAFVPNKYVGLAGDAMVAVGGYNLAKNYDLAGKIGITGTYDYNAVGNSQKKLSSADMSKYFHTIKTGKQNMQPQRRSPVVLSDSAVLS